MSEYSNGMKNYAPGLIEALAAHPGIPKFNHQIFLDILSATEVHKSRRFYAELPDESELLQRIETAANKYIDFSLRRVLRLYNIQPEYQMHPLKKAWGDFLSANGSFSSNAITRSLRADPEASRELLASPWPYAVLAKLKTYSVEHSQAPRALESKPIIIVPGIEQMDAILRWEDQNRIIHIY